MKAAGNCTFFRFLALMYLFPKPSAFKPPPPGLGDAFPLPLNGADLNFKALTKEQHADQGLQFMLSLYRGAADEDGKPRQSRAFGCNTVRLIRPSRPDAVQRRRASGSFDQQYTYRLDYELKILPKERLMKATFIHLRSSALSGLPVACEVSISSQSGSDQGVPLEGSVVLGPLDQWAETDVTPQVLVRRGSRLTLAMQYWCVKGSLFEPLEMEGGRQGGKPGISSSRALLRLPDLLLYLEEDGAPKGWAVPTKVSPSFTSVWPRRRRSKEPGSIGLDIPNYVRKSASPKNQCKLHSYRVTFRDLGWDHWIIAPHAYNPHYCQGDCPRILHYGYNSPNHAIIQNFISEMMAGEEVPPPSCVPYKYKPISVLMMEKNGTVTYKEYEDMIAESCTCR
ncbi:bone morphogenetic protein 15 [Paramormyrops kingsleyae]|uniref:bone morphogenetic protein 15 n=1 Tax=Paramormyrops kingsleyae TaxID=1676925 RepID=UPI003B9713D3